MDLFGIEFKRTFGFRRSRVMGMFEHEQELVNLTLHGYADSFRLWSENESVVLAQKPLVGKNIKETAKNLREHAKAVCAAARLLEQAKKNFWRAHKLAKDRGYLVEEKYTDYLRVTVH